MNEASTDRAGTPGAGISGARIAGAGAGAATVAPIAPAPIATPITARLLRPLLGTAVTVRTASRTLRGTLLSCVTGSAWLVVDDTDVVVDLDEVLSVHAA